MFGSVEFRCRAVAIATTVAAALAGAPAGAQGYYGYGHQWNDGWWGAGHMLFGGIGMILVLVIVVAVVALLVRWISPGAHPPHMGHYGPPPKTALDILKERFARGEIDKEEFEERRRTLGD